MSRTWDVVKAYLHTCRYEYFPGEAPAMLVPLLLTASICSVTFMVPNSAVKAPPIRPASITAA